MTPLRERFIQDLRIRNYAVSTIDSYTYHVSCFARHVGLSPEVLGPEEVRGWQVYLVTEKKVSWSSFNQAVCALRFLYRVTLPREWPVAMIPFGKKPKTLPVVLGGDEVAKFLSCIDVPLHRMGNRTPLPSLTVRVRCGFFPVTLDELKERWHGSTY